MILYKADILFKYHLPEQSTQLSKYIEHVIEVIEKQTGLDKLLEKQGQEKSVTKVYSHEEIDEVYESHYKLEQKHQTDDELFDDTY